MHRTELARLLAQRPAPDLHRLRRAIVIVNGRFELRRNWIIAGHARSMLDQFTMCQHAQRACLPSHKRRWHNRSLRLVDSRLDPEKSRLGILLVPKAVQDSKRRAFEIHDLAAEVLFNFAIHTIGRLSNAFQNGVGRGQDHLRRSRHADGPKTLGAPVFQVLQSRLRLAQRLRQTKRFPDNIVQEMAAITIGVRAIETPSKFFSQIDDMFLDTLNIGL
jgi:hypothetical protein